MPDLHYPHSSLNITSKRVRHLQQVTIVGAGRIGCPTAAVFASHHPTIDFKVIDIDPLVHLNWQHKGEVFREPKLIDLLYQLKNIEFLASTQPTIQLADMVMVCIPLPGSCSDVCNGLKPILETVKADSIIVIRSTMQVGSLDEVKRRIQLPIQDTDHISCKASIILSNPEFLSAGCSVKHLQRPDRVIIGYDVKTDKAAQTTVLERLYREWVPPQRTYCTSYKTAEMVKLGANVMQAQRIIGMNTLHALAENLRIDAAEVRDLIGMDHRLQGHNQNLRTGVDGPCLPNDIKTIACLAESCHLPQVKVYWDCMAQTNTWNRNSLIDNTVSALKLKLRPGATVTIVGFAFKPHTDEIRHSPTAAAFAPRLTATLVNAGFKLNVYDPLCTTATMHNEIIRHCYREESSLASDGNFAVYNQSLEQACESAAAILLTHGSSAGVYATADE